MLGVLRPRWLALAALVAVIVGAGGLLAGESRYSPMAWLVAELLIIYAAILWSTPAIPPLSTVPADAARSSNDHLLAADTRRAADGDEQVGEPVAPTSDIEQPR